MQFTSLYNCLHHMRTHQNETEGIGTPHADSSKQSSQTSAPHAIRHEKQNRLNLSQGNCMHKLTPSEQVPRPKANHIGGDPNLIQYTSHKHFLGMDDSAAALGEKPIDMTKETLDKQHYQGQKQSEGSAMIHMGKYNNKVEEKISFTDQLSFVPAMNCDDMTNMFISQDWPVLHPLEEQSGNDDERVRYDSLLVNDSTLTCDLTGPLPETGTGKTSASGKQTNVLYHCSTCSEDFVDYISLYAHMFRIDHTLTSRVACLITFSTMQRGLDQFECMLCVDAKLTSGGLVSHMTEHALRQSSHSPFRYHAFVVKKEQSPRPYSCNICTENFTSSSILAVHMISHLSSQNGTQRKPTQSCHKTISTSHSIEMHGDCHATASNRSGMLSDDFQASQLGGKPDLTPHVSNNRSGMLPDEVKTSSLVDKPSLNPHAAKKLSVADHSMMRTVSSQLFITPLPEDPQ